MLTQSDAQKILDHFHLGKILDFKDKGTYFELKTISGLFYILSELPLKARPTEEVRKQKLISEVGKLERVLLVNYKGDLKADNSYVHLKDLYYSLYK